MDLDDQGLFLFFAIVVSWLLKSLAMRLSF